MINYLNSGKIFKFILGAGNSNYHEIYDLIELYSSCGVKFFDIEASVEAVKTAKKAIGNNVGYICISVGVDNDIHFSKNKINSNCKKCLKCVSICLQEAINNFKIDEKKCIGCNRCLKICENNAIEKYYINKKWEEFLPELFPIVDCVEFHIQANNKQEIVKKWHYLCDNFSGMLSISTNRSMFGDVENVNLLKEMIEYSKRKIIIQADGVPMTGGKDDYNTTLQNIAFADVIRKNNLDCYLIVSGGTNSKTMELAKLLDVDIDGVALGSYARKVVKGKSRTLANEIVKDLICSVVGFKT